MTRNKQRTPAPQLAVALELGRAALDLALSPGRALAYLCRRRRLRAESARDLDSVPDFFEPAACLSLPARPLRVFVSCAETSGEQHTLALVRALRERIEAAGAPPPLLHGLGSERLARAGIELVGRPAERAAMGFDGMLRALPYYMGLLRDCAEHFSLQAPDLFLPVDSPALHVPLARIAQRYRVPTVHFVTPQYWGWAPWRVGGYARVVSRALTILPFEPAWFARNRVAVEHVGHPLLDSGSFESPRADHERDLLVVLPGSRAGIIERNLAWMLEVIAHIRPRLAALPVVLALSDQRGADQAREILARRSQSAPSTGAIEIVVGELAPILARSRAALSVSGTVLLDLARHRVPTVVLYRLKRRREQFLAKNMLTTPWFASVNLLANRELYPEFYFAGDGPLEAVGAALSRCYEDGPQRSACLEGLEQVARRLGPAGACDRAAAAALEFLAQHRQDGGAA